MQKILSIPLSAIYYLIFGAILAIFHPIQWVCLNWFGYNAHKKSVDILCLFIVANTHVLGTTYKVIGLRNLPQNSPLIIVANHQSMYDITSIIWFMRKIHPKFISKIELGKGIPSISYNLNHGGSVLIKRNDAKQSITAIKKMGEYIENTNRSAVIFPEGTRSKTGKPQKFAENGVKILCRYSPSAYVVPVTINNSWKLGKWGIFPLGLGSRVTLTIHPPMSVKDMPFQELFQQTEKIITESIA